MGDSVALRSVSSMKITLGSDTEDIDDRLVRLVRPW